jgi:hypothetical protein
VASRVVLSFIELVRYGNSIKKTIGYRRLERAASKGT